MQKILTAVTLALAAFAGTAHAADCAAQAAEKKLAGAAKTSFMKKCNKDAMAANPAAAACEKSAMDKKLAGAAKKSHMKKCMADGAASPSAAAASK